MPNFCPQCQKVGNASYHVDIAAIHRSFKNGQMVGTHVQSIMVQHKRTAQSIAPVRTGRLRREHFAELHAVKVGPIRSYEVGTHADYAIFLFGTAGKGAGWIVPKRHDFLELRPLPYSYFTVDDDREFEKVHGQRPHKDRNWLKRSLLRVLAQRGVLTISAAVAMSKDLDTKF